MKNELTFYFLGGKKNSWKHVQCSIKVEIHGENALKPADFNATIHKYIYKKCWSFIFIYSNNNTSGSIIKSLKRVN